MSGIYIHIPFCSKRCNYCDFFFITNTQLIERFLGNLHREIQLSSGIYKQEVFDTIYFGGGTPSLLSPSQLNEIINKLYSCYRIESPEITIEANPEDIIRDSLKDYRNAGINRMSFGVQSFSDKELLFLTRSHTAAQAENVIRDALEELGNVNVDIIYSLPGQSADELYFSLRKAVELNVPHISAYTLTYEPQTVLFKQLQQKKFIINPEEKEAEMYIETAKVLKDAGYIHYEVSNFAKPSFESKHNLKYWEYNSYAGLGPSAHSFLNGRRWNNCRDIVKYSNCLESGKLAHENEEVIGETEKEFEYVMLGLRSKGVDSEKYSKVFGKRFEEVYNGSLRELMDKGYIVNVNGSYRFTEEGYAIADGILAKYF
jgi:oxygen-independent coproporphyrinogen-3 oxidase